MSTTIHDGDYLFGKYVDNFDDILDGRIYVIISKNDGVVVKRVLNRIHGVISVSVIRFQD